MEGTKEGSVGEVFSKLDHDRKEAIILVQVLINCGLPIFVNKVILEQSHKPSFKYYLWLLLYHGGRAEGFLQRLCGLQTENIYYLAHYRMSVLTPAFLGLHSRWW